MTIWDFLGANLLPLLIFLGLLVALVVFLTFKLRPTKIGPVEFKIDKKQAAQIADRYLRSVEKIRDLQSGITQIDSIGIIRDQMQYADNVLDELEKDIKDIHHNLVYQQSDESDYSEVVSELETYALRVRLSIDDIRSEIRRAFRENHLHEKDPAEFNEYVNDKLSSLIKIIQGINTTLRKSPVVSVETLRKETMAKEIHYRKMLGRVFKEAWEISTERREEIKEKQTVIRNIVERYLAQEPLDDAQ